MKKTLLLLVPVLLALALPGVVQARPGQLDRSFGGGGRVTTRVGTLPRFTTRSYFAWAGGGQIVAAIGPHLVEYAPDGRLDKRFGGNGRVKIEVAQNSSFLPSGLAVDSRGRILVSGAASHSELGELRSSAATVMRFFPNGRPDRSFGNGGIALDDFGFPNPSHEGQPESRGPFVGSSGVSVDSADRPLLTGSWWSYDPSPCYMLYCYSASKPFIARLHEDGSPDESFSSGGIFTGAPGERTFFPVATDEKVLFVTSNSTCGPRCGNGDAQLGRLLASGSLDLSFGSGGFSDLPFYGDPSVAIDRFGRLLMVGENAEESSIFLLQRLTPRGTPDGSFGDHGTRWMNLPRGCRRVPQALAVDHHDRPVLASNGRRAGQNYLIVFRRNVRGGRDRGFGGNGQVWTRMPNLISPTQVLIGGDGKIVVAGTLSGKGLALARYSGGH